MNHSRIIIITFLFMVPHFTMAALAIPGTPNIPPPLQPLPAQIAPNASHNIDYHDPNASIPAAEQNGPPVQSDRNFLPINNSNSERGVASQSVAPAANSAMTGHWSGWRVIGSIMLILLVLLYMAYRFKIITFTRSRL